MKRIILSVAVLATALANAQVGINEENPKATLDIKAKTANTTNDLEGLLVPRVSINKALQMSGNTDIKESTMIYVNDIGDYTISNPSTTAEEPILDITENGYYFWNGTKWVKTVGNNGAEWAYNPSNQRVELVRSGQGNFVNKVYFSKKGDYNNIDNPDAPTLSFGIPSGSPTGTSPTDYVDNVPHGASRHQTRVMTSSLQVPSNTQPNIWGGVYGSAQSVSSYFDEVPDQITNYTNSSSSTYIPSAVSSLKDLKGLSNSSDNLIYNAPYEFETLTGSYLRTTVGTDAGEILGTVYGGRHQTVTYSNQDIKSIIASDNYNYIRSNGNIKNVSGSTDWVAFQNQSTATVDYLAGHTIFLRSWQNSTPTIDKARGMLIAGFTESSGSIPTIRDYVGLYISDIKNATDKNYAIYTNAGDIRFGGLADSGATGNRLVAVDTDGKLVIGSSASNVGLWENDTTNQLVKLTNTSAGVARANTNRVTIGDDGKITAKGFVGYNGATIFPDYVFQKYYTGESSIKEDYNFNTLEQVENFVKANGHLPGYTSAKEIAEKGIIDLGATQLTNVEKIEELYLHTIEQQKEIKDLKELLNAQQQQIEDLKALIKK